MEDARPGDLSPWLASWLGSLGLEAYQGAAKEWIEEWGAFDVAEIFNHIDSFAEALQMKALEKALVRV